MIQLINANLNPTNISKEVYDILTKYGEDSIKEMITRLKNLDKIASGKLVRSLKYDIRSQLGGLQLYFEMEDYGVRVDQGVNGKLKTRNSKSPYNTDKFPPKKADISKWCQYRKIDKSKASIIQRSIYLYGTEPTFFFTITTSRNQSRIEKKLEQAVSDSFEKL